MGSRLETTALAPEDWQQFSRHGFAEEELVMMERLRFFSSAMLKQAATDLAVDIDVTRMPALRDAAEHGDRAAEKEYNDLQEHLLNKNTAQQWIEHWRDRRFDVPFDWCALAIWPNRDPEEVAQAILAHPAEYLSIAHEQDTLIAGPRINGPRKPRPS